MVMQKLLRAATPSLRELAEECGIPYSTLKAWSSGARVPSQEGARIVIDAVRERSRRLAELADRLERAATLDPK